MISPMELPGSIFILLGLLIGLNIVCSSDANKIYVGGREGWVENPKEEYNQWAGRLRFSVNDTLYFKYKKGDSVLLVSRDDYIKCNTNNPIKKWVDGSSDFTLDRSGPFFFVGGTNESCKKGQRMIVIVLAVQPRPTRPVQAPTPSPLPPQGPSPVSPTPLAPQPHGSSPASPSASPPHSWPTPASTPSSAAKPPAKSPSPATPSTPPVPPPASPVLPPSSSATSTSSTPAHSPAPAPAPSSAWAMAPMSAWVLAGTLLFSGLIV